MKRRIQKTRGVRVYRILDPAQNDYGAWAAASKREAFSLLADAMTKDPKAFGLGPDDEPEEMTPPDFVDQGWFAVPVQ